MVFQNFGNRGFFSDSPVQIASKNSKNDKNVPEFLDDTIHE